MNKDFPKIARAKRVEDNSPLREGAPLGMVNVIGDCLYVAESDWLTFLANYGKALGLTDSVDDIKGVLKKSMN